MKPSALPSFALAAALGLLCLAPDCDQLSGGSSDSTDDGEDEDGGAEAKAARARAAYAAADCEKRGKCTVSLGGAHSQTECTQATAIEYERADSRGCGDSYDSYLQCLAALSYDCSLSVAAQIQAGCGSQATALANCN